MSDYVLKVDWAGKDNLSDSDTAKIITGADFNTEFIGVRDKLNNKADENGNASEHFRCNILEATSGTITGKGAIATLAEPQMFTKVQYTQMSAYTMVGASHDVSLEESNVFKITVEGADNILGVDIPSSAAGMEITFIVVGDATAELGYSADFKFADGAPIIAASTTDLLKCTCDGFFLYCNVTQDLI